MSRARVLISAAWFCACSSLAHAALGGGGADQSQNPMRSPRAPVALERIAPMGDDFGGRSATHEFDFWQEAEPRVFETRTCAAACADLDGDGSPEYIRLGIAYGDPHGGTLEIVLGDEYGPHGSECFRQLLPSPRSVRALDLNGDGLIDVIAAHMRPVPNTSNSFVRCATLFIQTGAPGGAIEFLDPPPCVDLAPGGEILQLVDVDRDQVADLVSVGMAHELYYQKGLGLSVGVPAVPTFSAQAVNVSQLAAQTAGLPPGSTFNFGFASDLAAGDFDGDGSNDLAVAAGSIAGGGVHVYFQRSGGWDYQRFGGPVPGGPPSVSFGSLARGDFDGDGLDDLVATSPSRGLTTLLNASSVSAGSNPGLPRGMVEVVSDGVALNSRQAVSDDFDADGRDDVACLDANDSTLLVLYNTSGTCPPGEFSILPAFSSRADVRGFGLCALEALDVDRDGDVDLVGSFLFSRSASIVCNERAANARKPTSMLRLIGEPASGALSDAFVPDGLELIQAPSPNLHPKLALDRFTFQATPVAGRQLRLRAQIRGLRPGSIVRIGLLDHDSGQVSWVLGRRLPTARQELAWVTPSAARFVSAAGEVQAFVMSQSAEADFDVGIDQLSVELIP